ncbi:hypothetical protein NEFER01_2237, partial [Nematocida sp. LUAm1]
ERIVSFKDLEIHGQNISIKNDDLNSVVEDCGLKSKQKDALQKLNWEVNKKISMIRLEKCSKDIIEYCLKFYIPRNFSDLEIIESPDIKEIDLSMINLKKKRNILLADFPQLESIVFLVETDMECPSLFLECLPKLKKITNFDTFISSGVLLCELHVDWEIFKKIEEMCRRVTKEPLVSSLLEIYCVPYPPEDIDILPHYPWIHVDNLRMHIRIPNSYTSIEDNEKNSYSADVVRNMGINLLDGVEYSGKLELPEDFKSYQSEFMDSIMVNKEATDLGNAMCFKYLGENYLDLNMPYLSTCSILPIIIHLERSKEIQEAIEKFRIKHTSICDHIIYTSIEIKGAANPVSKNKQAELLIDIFSCLGESIRGDHAYFYDMKGPVVSEIQEKLLTLPKSSCYKFRLKALYFYSSELEFIEFMLTQHTYYPNMKITIDCGKFNGEDTWKLINIAMKHKPKTIHIQDAFEFMQKLTIEKYIIDDNMKKRLFFLSLAHKRAVENLHVSEDLFQKGFSIQPLTFSILNRNIKNIINGESQVDSYFLLHEKSIEDACALLKNITGTIDSVSKIRIFMYISDPNYYTTQDSLCEFFKLVAEVFVNIYLLHVEHLRIKKEDGQDENLHKLQLFLSETKIHKLKCITFNKFILIDSKNPSLNDKKQKYYTQYFKVGNKFC